MTLVVSLQFKCCGFVNYTDFDGSPFVSSHGGNIYPTSCCNETVLDNNKGVCSLQGAEDSVCAPTIVAR